MNSIAMGITQRDIVNINEYNRLVGVEGVSSQTAWNRTMLTSSATAQGLFDNQENLVRSGRGLVLSQKAILTRLRLMNVEVTEVVAERSCTKADLEAALAQELKNKTDERGILTTLGVGDANLFTADTFKLLGLQAKKTLLALAKNPLTWIIAGIAGFVAIIDLCSTSVKEHEEELENLKTEYSEIKSELDCLNNELQTTQSRIAELESKDKLTFAEGEELENLKKQNNEYINGIK